MIKRQSKLFFGIGFGFGQLPGHAARERIQSDLRVFKNARKRNRRVGSQEIHAAALGGDFSRSRKVSKARENGL